MNTNLIPRINQSDSKWSTKKRQKKQKSTHGDQQTVQKEEDVQTSSSSIDENDQSSKQTPTPFNTQIIQNPNISQAKKLISDKEIAQQIKKQSPLKLIKEQSSQGQNDYQLDISSQNMSKDEQNNNQAFQQGQYYQNNNRNNIGAQQQQLSQPQKQSFSQTQQQTTPMHDYQYPQYQTKQPNNQFAETAIPQNNNQYSQNQQQLCQLKQYTIQQQQDNIIIQIMKESNSNSNYAQQQYPNILFYAGINKSNFGKSYYIYQLHKRFGNYDILESDHEYIQWIFPNKYKSNFNGNSKPLNEDEISIFLKEPLLAENYIKSYEMMLDFYGMRIINKQTGELSRNQNYKERYKNAICGHNIWRIRRILTSLSNLGFRIYAINLCNFLKKEITEGDRPLSNLYYSYQNELQFYEETKDGSYVILEKNCIQKQKQISRQNIFFQQFKKNNQKIPYLQVQPSIIDKSIIHNDLIEISLQAPENIYEDQIQQNKPEIKSYNIFQKFWNWLFICYSDKKETNLDKQKKSKSNKNKIQAQQPSIEEEQKKILNQIQELCQKKNLKESKFENVLFYAGIYESNHFSKSINCVSVIIDQMQSQLKNYNQVQGEFSYIKWLFPNKLQFSNNSGPQPLNEEEISIFLNEPFLAGRYVQNYEIVLDFYGMKMVDKKTGRLERSQNYQQRYCEAFNQHDITLIKRILTSLYNMGFRRYANQLCKFLKYEIYQQDRPLKMIEQYYQEKLKMYENNKDNNYTILEYNCFQFLHELNRENIFLKNVDKK